MASNLVINSDSDDTTQSNELMRSYHASKSVRLVRVRETKKGIQLKYSDKRLYIPFIADQENLKTAWDYVNENIGKAEATTSWKKEIYIVCS